MDLYREYKKPYKSILFILTNSVSDFRLALASRWLKSWGYNTDCVNAVPAWLATYYDVIVASRPVPDLIPMLDIWMKAGKPVIIDMDDDFKSIPPSNPAYKILGQGRIGYHKELVKIINQCTILTVTTPELVTRFRKPRTVIVPNCWDETNELWKGKFERETVNIGWIGTQTHWDDFLLVKDDIIRVLADRSNTKVVIGLDEKIFELFEAVPEDRKLFIPGMPYSVYPSFYHHTDIILAPLRNTVFTRAKSEIKLVEAGAAGQPWLASPLPFYQDWGAGGKIVPDGQWYQALIDMVDMPNLRGILGDQGHTEAMTRTSEVTSRMWEVLINTL